MFIEDEELRTLYKTASAEHLEAIELGLIYLEKAPQDRESLKALLRATHSLKGDSRMLGVMEAETLVHQMEEVLSTVDQGQQPLSPVLCDRLYQGVDALRKIAHEATTGEPSGVSMFQMMALLMGADEALIEMEPVLASAIALPEDDLDALIFFDPLQVSFSGTVEAQAMTAAAEPLPEKSFQLDTLRVESAKLDTLMTQADELAVTNLRIARRFDDLTELLTLWEDWSREFSQPPAALETQLNPTERQALQQFYQRNEQRLAQLGQLLGPLHRTAAEDTARLEMVANELENGIRNLRMVPLSSIFNLFPRMVRDLARHQAKQINFVVEGDDILADKRILEEIKDPLIHLLRNAIDHGIEPVHERLVVGKPKVAMLRLKGTQSGSQICLEISDDGRGLDVEAIRATALRRGLHTEAELAQLSPAQIQALIVAPGFSTRTTVTEISGRGVGLDVVRANIERLKGSIQIESVSGQGCTFRIMLKMNLAAGQALIVEANAAPYAIPLEAIETLQLVNREEIFPVEGNLTMNWQGRPISVTWLSDALNLPVHLPRSAQSLQTLRKSIPCVVIHQGSEYLGLLVDDFLDQQQIVVKPHSKLLKRVRNIAGATILSNGEVCMVLNTQDLLRTGGAIASRTVTPPLMEPPRVLLVEDSIPIRTQLQRILAGAGYAVTVAVDGLDGLTKLKLGTFDAIVSDVEMPNLTGLELTRRVREFPEYGELPIILVTTLAQEEDKYNGAEAGADAYLTKGSFDQSLLLNTLRRLI